MSSLSLLPSLVSLCSNLLLLPHPPPPTSLALLPTQQQQRQQQSNLTLQLVVQGPSSPRPYNLIYHRPTNSCLLTDAGHSPPTLGPCTSSDYWYYTPQGLLTIKGSYFCLQAPSRPGLPARLDVACPADNSRWDNSSNTSPSGASRTAISTPDGRLCLDVGPDGSSVVANPCVSTADDQWFEVLDVGKDGRAVLGAANPAIN